MTSIPRAGLLAVLIAAPAWAAVIAVPGDMATIQAAINAAADGDVIQIAPGTYTERIGVHQVRRFLTVRGDPDAPASVTIDGGGQGDTVRVTSTGPNVIFEGLTITGGSGNTDYGGGLFMSDAAAVFRRCVFRDNSAPLDGGGAFLLNSPAAFQECEFRDNTAGRFGGGVMLNLGADALFDRCIFADNQSGTSDPSFGSGGALHASDSSPLVVGSLIEGNHSKGAAGGVMGFGNWDQPEAVLTLRDTIIRNNQSERMAAPAPVAEGGGMHIEDNVLAVLEGCVVNGNTANHGGGLNAYRARYRISGSRIEGNTADPDADGGGAGGGLYAPSVNTSTPPRRAAEVTIERSVVRDNTADLGGGVFVQGDFVMTSNRASLTITDSIVAGNIAAVRGGGIGIDRTDATITRSLVLENVVTDTDLGPGGGLVATGGSGLTVVDSTFAGNQASDLGGGIYIDQGGTIDVSDSRFFGNLTTDPGDGGGAIAIGGSEGPIAGPISGTVRDSVIADNGSSNELWEMACPATLSSVVTYVDNAIHSTSGRAFFRACLGLTPTAEGIDAIMGKGSGNVTAVPDFASLLAAPPLVRAGGTAVVGFVVADPAGVTLAPGLGAIGTAIGTRDVTPAVTTTYALADGPTTLADATVTVTCAGVGVPVPVVPAPGGRAGFDPLTVKWLPADGATSYDVLIDTEADPSTIQSAGVTETMAAITGLTPATTYRWKVVARSAMCVEPIEGPVREFTTCDHDPCEFTDDFADGDVSDWRPLGPGQVGVVDGRLEVQSAKTGGALAPADPLADGTIALNLRPTAGKLLAHVLFGWVNERTYGALIVREAKGRWKLKLLDRTRKRARKAGAGKVTLATDAPRRLEVAIAGGTVTVTVDGAAALTGRLKAPAAGSVGVLAVKSTVQVDDVLVIPTAP